MKQSSAIHRWFVVIWVGLLTAVFPTQPTFAHGGITADGSASDWANLGNGSCPSAPSANTGAVIDGSHTDCGLGVNGGTEWVWTDATGDQRTDHWGSTGNMDITQVRITGDATNLNFLLRFSDITNCNAQYIAIGINSNDGSGTTFFPDNADTGLGAFGSGYERVIEANLNTTGYWSDNSTFTSSLQSNCSASENLWEIQMPISALGLTWPAASGTYDFAIAVFCHDSGGGICDVGGSSDAMDVVTSTSGNTWNEVSDGSLDYNFTMGFGPTAVNLQTLTAQPAANTLTIIAIALVLLLGGITAVFHTKNEKGQHHASP